ncbi:MAG: ribose-5-phosphate isomerase RpiA [Acidobacteriota bacterium]|nr:ribose-5-phosphate isomerase RpiA [Acidobacteriota bacterium]
MDALKRAAGEAAATLIKDGMVVGLGTGSTAKFAVDAIGVRVKSGLKILGIPTSGQTAAQARSLGIPLGELSADRRVDLTIDGADEVDIHSLDLIKGRGGALLREKIVASVSDCFVIVVDESKLVERLGQRVLPIEVVPFGWEATAQKLRQLGAVPTLRKSNEREAFMSEGGHYILDCTLNGELSPGALGVALDGMVGVVEHGLFLGMTSRVFAARADGMRELTR